MLWALLLLVAAVWAVRALPRLWVERRRPPPVASQVLAKRDAAPEAVARMSGGGYRSSAGATGPDVTSRKETDRSRVLIRRRRVMVVLLFFAVGTLALAAVTGALGLLVAHLAVDTAIAWYVVMLRRIKAMQAAADALRRMSEREEETFHLPRVKVVQSR